MVGISTKTNRFGPPVGRSIPQDLSHILNGRRRGVWGVGLVVEEAERTGGSGGLF